MSVPIQIRDDLYDRLKEMKKSNVDGRTSLSFSDVLDKLLSNDNNLQEATITPEGQISKDLAGKTILYRIKDITLTPN